MEIAISCNSYLETRGPPREVPIKNHFKTPVLDRIVTGDKKKSRQLNFLLGFIEEG